MFEINSIYEWVGVSGLVIAIIGTVGAILWTVGCCLWAWLDDKEKWWLSSKLNFGFQKGEEKTQKMRVFRAYMEDKISFNKLQELKAEGKYEVEVPYTYGDDRGTPLFFYVLSGWMALGFLSATIMVAIWVVITLILPNLAVFLWVASVPVSLYLTRFVIRLNKKLNAHVNDVDAHKKKEKESETSES